MEYANNAKNAADEGNWEDSTYWWGQTEYKIWDYTNYIDFYNILLYEGWTREQRLKQFITGMDEFKFGLQLAAKTSNFLVEFGTILLHDKYEIWLFFEHQEFEH